MATKKKSLIKVFNGSKEKVKEPRIPKRKSNKGCYITPEELGELIIEYIDQCSDPDKMCIRKKCSKYKKCDQVDCPNRIVMCEGKLSDVIWKMAVGISMNYSFRKHPEILNDLPSVGYITIVSKLRNMEKKDPNSAFSYITTVIKNAYKAYKKDFLEYGIMKMEIEIEFKHNNLEP